VDCMQFYACVSCGHIVLVDTCRLSDLDVPDRMFLDDIRYC
jgi:hypothetical protein